jgi:hypothetical protein
MSAGGSGLLALLAGHKKGVGIRRKAAADQPPAVNNVSGKNS